MAALKGCATRAISVSSGSSASHRPRPTEAASPQAQVPSPSSGGQRGDASGVRPSVFLCPRRTGRPARVGDERVDLGRCDAEEPCGPCRFVAAPEYLDLEPEPSCRTTDGELIQHP